MILQKRPVSFPPQSSRGVVPRAQELLLETNKIRKLEEEFIPESLQRNYEKTFGHKKH